MQKEKTIVIYKSKRGSTKQYAEWISQELCADIFEESKIKLLNLENYNTIIFGGWVFAAKIQGINFIKNEIKKLKNKGKNIFIFFVGTADYSKKENFNKIINSNFTREELDLIKIFSLRGVFNPNKVGLFLNFFLNIAKSGIENKIKNKEEITNEDKEFLEFFAKPSDFIKKENIIEIVQCVNNYKNN